MLYPKLSAVLNNCPLHAVTPEIIAEVENFAKIDNYQNNHNAQYTRLKSLFAKQYGLDERAFSWAEFSGILERYNPHDAQIIMGPVLRTFMKDIMREDDFTILLADADDMEVDYYINKLTELTDGARYFSLSPDEVSTYVGKPLGLSIQYQKNEQVQNIPAPHSITTVMMYHQGGISGAGAGGHWEKTDLGRASVDYLAADTCQLGSFLPLLGENNDVNPTGLSLLRQHVQLTAQSVKSKKELAEEFAELALTTAQIQKYLFNINSVPKVLAVKLLGSGLTEDTTKFIDNYTGFIEVLPKQIFENYIEAQDIKPKVDERELTLIKTMLELVKMPEFAARQLKAFREKEEQALLEKERQEQLKQEQLKQEQLKQEQLKQEQLKQEQLKQEQLKQEQLKQEQLKQEQLKQEQLKQEQLKQEQLKQEQLKQEQLKNELVPYKRKFEDLVLKLEMKKNELNLNRKTDIGYKKIVTVMEKLCTTLNHEKNNFFENPSIDSFDNFQKQCIGAVQEVEGEAANHRGWHQVHPILRCIVGVLAAIAIIPALVVESRSRHGYLQTFFAKPQTDTSQKVSEVKQKFEDDIKEIEKIDGVTKGSKNRN